MKVPAVPEPTGSDVGDVLDDLARFLTRFVVFPVPHYVTAVTLWAVHTHLVHRLRVTIYLHVTSPEPESGKSQLLDVLALVVRSPWQVIQPSEAVLFRKIDADAPTLLLDEVDPIFSKKSGNDSTAEGLRAILNAGYQAGRPVPRCVGPSQSVRDFQVFGAKAIAGIGDVPDTVASRSIRIGMKRRRPDETIEPLFPDEIEEETADLHDRLQAAADAVDLTKLRPIRRELLGLGLGDRAADGWASLVAIADTFGWSEKAREAAAALSAKGAVARDDRSTGKRLLADIRAVVADVDKIHTATLLDKLTSIEEAPWGEWFGKPLTARSLARLLEPYGVSSKPVRVGDKVLKGYVVADFADPFARYLPPERVTRVTTLTPQGNPADPEGLQDPLCNPSETGENRSPARDVTHVTDKGADTGATVASEPCSKCGHPIPGAHRFNCPTLPDPA